MTVDLIALSHVADSHHIPRHLVVSRPALPAQSTEHT